MNKHKIIISILALSLLFLVGCENGNDIVSPQDNSDNMNLSSNPLNYDQLTLYWTRTKDPRIIGTFLLYPCKAHNLGIRDSTAIFA